MTQLLAQGKHRTLVRRTGEEKGAVITGREEGGSKKIKTNATKQTRRRKISLNYRNFSVQVP